MCVIAAGAGIAAAGSIGGALINSNAAGNAAQAQENAANSANQTQLSMFNTTNANQAPWRQAGGQAVNALSQFYGLGGVSTPGANGQPGTTGGAGAPNFSQILQNLPGYQFQMQQGTQAVDRNLAAQGLLQSGAAGKALTQYGQGLAQQYSGQYVNGLQSLAGLGQQSVQSTGIIGQQAANQIGSNQIYAGNAQATGYANQAGAVNSGINGAIGGIGYGLSNMNYAPPSTPGYYGGVSNAGANFNTGQNVGSGSVYYNPEGGMT